jgi:hypothetical protein
MPRLLVRQLELKQEKKVTEHSLSKHAQEHKSNQGEGTILRLVVVLMVIPMVKTCRLHTHKNTEISNQELTLTL